MESWRVFSRGWKLAILSLVPSFVQFLIYVTVYGLAVVSLVIPLRRLTSSLMASWSPGEDPLIILWWCNRLVHQEWRGLIIWFLLISLWFGVLSLLYFYGEAGIVGWLVSRDAVLEKSGQASLREIKGSVGASGSEVLKNLFRIGLTHGWRVTKLAGAYLGIGLLPVLVLEVVFVLSLRVAILHRNAVVPALLVFIGALVLVLIVSFLLLIHYGCALVYTVRDGMSVRRAVRSSSIVLKRRWIVFLGVILFQYAVNMAVGVVSNPVAFAIAALIMFKLPMVLVASTVIIFVLLRLYAHSMVKVASYGCYVSFCTD